jgi:hypothetical protein
VAVRHLANIPMIKKKKILFVGCSHTADSGFTPENQPKHHWPWLISNHYDCYFQNAAIGGSSNDEIFYRCSETILSYKFDLVIVMWSSLSRKWLYFENKNVDDFTIINNGVCTGFNHANIDLKYYAKLHYSNFDNKFIDLKRWLLQTITLANLLSSSDTKFIFIKGFENYINDIIKSKFDVKGFTMTNDLKKILDFDNRPDYYINEKLYNLKSLAAAANQEYWLNFNSFAFSSKHYAIDLSDDGKHLGKLSNIKIYQDLIKYIEEKNLPKHLL